MKARMYRYGQWIPDTDPAALRRRFLNMLDDCGFEILDEMQHHFKPQGWSWAVLLAESHLAIHTFPEEGQTWVELSSCVQPPYKRFLELFAGADE